MTQPNEDEKKLPLTKGFVQLGHDVETIIGSVSRPEIGCLQINQNGTKRPDYSGVPEHGMWVP